MNVDDLRGWATLASTLLSIGAVVYAWLTSGSKAALGKIEQMEARLAATERRMDQVETDLHHLPDKDHAQRMELALAEMRGEVKVLNERLIPVAATSARLQEFLFERTK